MRGVIAEADAALLRFLRDQAPTLATVLLVVTGPLYFALWFGTWGDVEALRWLVDLLGSDQATSSASGLVVACASLFVAIGVSRRERTYGHDGWWWGFGIFALGAFGLALWLAHYDTAHRVRHTEPSRGVSAST